MKLAFIGMSNVGKSYWSKKLATEKDFKRFCCDDFIEEKLGDQLKALGYSGIQDVARWMGQPYDPQYSKTGRQYLEFEQEGMRQVLAALEATDEDMVIDTTGSVIYTGDDILQALAANTTVVYFETPASVQEEMRRLYIAEPKPVIWGDSFNKRPGETDTDALKRCYPELLAYRTQKYQKLADITLDYHLLRQPGFTLDKFMEAINSGRPISAKD